MTESHGFLQYFLSASPVVKTVLLILLAASIASWTFILQRRTFYRRLSKAIHQFDETIWRQKDLVSFYQDLKKSDWFQAGLEYIFTSGFKEFLHTRKVAAGNTSFVMESTDRAMQVAQAKEVAKLEKHLPFLASVGSVSPYVGLFGTVWGIMMAFHGIAGAEQVTIAMVAPGIAEALVATAMGLFAAIPAVLAYNFYSHKVGFFIEEFEQFQEKLSLSLHQALYAEMNHG